MSEFKFSCPHCEQHLQCDEQFSGRQIQCPHCNVLIRIPPAPGKTAQFEAQSGMTWATHVPTPKGQTGGNIPTAPKKDPPKPPAK